MENLGTRDRKQELGTPHSPVQLCLRRPSAFPWSRLPGRSTRLADPESTFWIAVDIQTWRPNSGRPATEECPIARYWHAGDVVSRWSECEKHCLRCGPYRPGCCLNRRNHQEGESESNHTEDNSTHVAPPSSRKQRGRHINTPSAKTESLPIATTGSRPLGFLERRDRKYSPRSTIQSTPGTWPAGEQCGGDCAEVARSVVSLWQRHVRILIPSTSDASAGGGFLECPIRA